LSCRLVIIVVVVGVDLAAVVALVVVVVVVVVIVVVIVIVVVVTRCDDARLQAKMAPTQPGVLSINKKRIEFAAPSWSNALVLMADTSFLRSIRGLQKDNINQVRTALCPRVYAPPSLRHRAFIGGFASCRIARDATS
jgi:hypothetical protein